MARPIGDPVTIFWNHVSRGAPHACWLWTGCHTDFGHGQLRIGGRAGKTVLAHRFSYELHTGPIPDSGVVRHKCDNPSCVNPAHLLAGTHADNVNDRIIRGRSRPARGAAVGVSKLTDADVLAIRQRHADGETITAIARSYPAVARSTVSNAAHGVYWKHVA